MKLLKYFLLALIPLIIGSCASGARMAQSSQPVTRDSTDQKAYDHYLDGALHDFQGDFEKGLIEYYQALLYDSTSAQIYKAIARNLMRLQKYESASQYLKKAKRLDPDNKEILTYLGESYFKQNKYEKSLSYYEKLFALDPYNTSLQNNLVYLYNKLDMNQRLLEFYRKMMTYYPGDTQQAIRYALTALKLKKIDQARQVLEQVVSKDTTQLKALFVLGSLYEVNNDTAGAIRIFRKVLEKDPLFEEALSHLYNIYRAKNDWQGIQETYSKFIEQDSTNARARLILAQAYFFSEQRDLARQTLKPLLDNPDYRPAALELLGRIAFNEENLTEAENYFLSLTKENPDNQYGWIFLSTLYNRQQEYHKSIKILREALTFQPNDDDLLGMYGATLSQMGRENEALEPLEKAHRIDPDDLNTIVSLAAVYDKLNSWNKSDSLYESALREYPENALLLNNYSYSLTERGIQLDRALKMVKKALEKEPDNSAYLDTIGWIYFKIGDYQLALKYIKQATDSDDASSEVIEHLGDIYMKLGKPEEARRSWEKALEMDPDNTELKQKIQKL